MLVALLDPKLVPTRLAGTQREDVFIKIDFVKPTLHRKDGKNTHPPDPPGIPPGPPGPCDYFQFPGGFWKGRVGNKLVIEWSAASVRPRGALLGPEGSESDGPLELAERLRGMAQSFVLSPLD